MPGFHVNSDKPRDEFLIPLKLTWTPGPLEAETVSYPKPEEAQVGKDKLLVFTGDFEIRTEFKVPATAPAGQAALTGKLRYQACNEQMCFRPSSVEIHVPIVIE